MARVSGQTQPQFVPFGRGLVRLHGLQGVQAQVDHHLFEQHAVGMHLQRGCGRLDAHRNPLAAGLGAQQQLQRLLHDGRQVAGLAAFRVLAHPAADAAHDVGCPERLGRQGFEAVVQWPGLALGGQCACRRRVVDQGRERLVQFVRQGGGHLAHRDHALHPLQLGLALLLLFLGPLLRGDVDHRTHPADVLAAAVDEARGVEHGVNVRPVAVPQAVLPPLGKRVAGQHGVAVVPVPVEVVGVPVGVGRQLSDEFVGPVAHHVAHGGVDVDDAAFEVARAHAHQQ